MKVIALTVEIEAPDDESRVSLDDLLSILENECARLGCNIYDTHWEEV